MEPTREAERCPIRQPRTRTSHRQTGRRQSTRQPASREWRGRTRRRRSARQLITEIGRTHGGSRRGFSAPNNRSTGLPRLTSGFGSGDNDVSRMWLTGALSYTPPMHFRLVVWRYEDRAVSWIAWAQRNAISKTLAMKREHYINSWLISDNGWNSCSTEVEAISYWNNLFTPLMALHDCQFFLQRNSATFLRGSHNGSRETQERNLFSTISKLTVASGAKGTAWTQKTVTALVQKQNRGAFNFRGLNR